jgi:hypothetical protein
MHIIGVWDGQKMYLYIDGNRQIDVQNFTNPASHANDPLAMVLGTTEAQSLALLTDKSMMSASTIAH